MAYHINLDLKGTYAKLIMTISAHELVYPPGFYTEFFDWGGGGGSLQGGCVFVYPPWGYLVMGGV